MSDEWDIHSSANAKGIRLKYRMSVIYSDNFRTTLGNTEAALKALACLEGIPYTELKRKLVGYLKDGLVIESYKSS